eukprot:c23743_g1_i1 orf=298-1572(-)
MVSIHHTQKYSNMRSRTLAHKMVFNSVTATEILMLALVSTSVFALTSASKGKIGADYGLNGDNLLSPVQAVALIRAKGINAVTVLEARPDVTRAFAGSGISLTITVSNRDVPAVARNLREAISWVREQVLPFPASGISAVIVGNRWLDHSIHDPFLLVPAMQNIHSALSALLLGGIKVSTSHASSVLKSGPINAPSTATFADRVIEVMRPLVRFLADTDSFFLVDIFPYRAYEADPSIPIELLLFEPTKPVQDPNTGLNYTNLYDLQLDAVYAALASLELSTPTSMLEENSFGIRSGDEHVYAPSMHAKGNIMRVCCSTGDRRGRGTGSYSEVKGIKQWYSTSAVPVPCGRACQVETVEIARTYNQNLIRHVLKAKGTPANPSTPIQANIFEIFDEDLNPPLLQNFGFFFPNGTAAYPLNFHPK